MVNATLVRRLARADGILLRPDRPMAPVDAMFGSLVGGSVRAMPGLCTHAQETGPNAANASCGARLWQTHATVYPEDATKAPELAVAPTRRLVSHAGVDATDQSSVPEALAASDGRHLLSHLVVSVDQPDSFKLQVRLQYMPTIDDLSLILWTRYRHRTSTHYPLRRRSCCIVGRQMVAARAQPAAMLSQVVVSVSRKLSRQPVSCLTSARLVSSARRRRTCR